MEVVNQEEAVEQQPQPMPESSITAMPSEEIARPGSADEEDQLFQDVFAEGAEMEQAEKSITEATSPEAAARESAALDVDQPSVEGHDEPAAA